MTYIHNTILLCDPIVSYIKRLYMTYVHNTILLCDPIVSYIKRLCMTFIYTIRSYCVLYKDIIYDLYTQYDPIV